MPTKSAVNQNNEALPAGMPGVNQKLDVSGSSVQSEAFGEETSLIRIATTVGAFVKVGEDPEAADTDMFIPASSVEYFAVNVGEKIAIIQNDESGFATVTEMK